MVSLRTLTKFAAKAVHKQHHHVAILTRGGAIVAIGWNHGECHAEEKALQQVWCDHRPGLVLWSFRLTRAGKLAFAKPCPHCEAMLRSNGVRKVHYSDRDGTMAHMKLTPN